MTDDRDSRRRRLRRWGVSLLVVLMAHAAVAAGLMSLPGPAPHGGIPPSPILIDLTPAAAPMASIEEVSKQLPEPEPTEPLAPMPSPVIDMVPTPEPPPEVKIEITIAIPPPEPPPPVDLKPPEKVVDKAPPKPPEKVVPKRTEPARAPPSPAPVAPAAAGAPSPAPPSATPQPNPRGVASWQGALLTHLARHKRYPRASQDRGDEGVVHLRFTMTRQGAVLSQHVAKSSGYAPLDAEALALVRRAQPLPAPPADMAGEQFELLIPIQFSLR